MSPKDPLEPLQFPAAPGSSETVEAAPPTTSGDNSSKKKHAEKAPPQKDSSKHVSRNKNPPGE